MCGRYSLWTVDQISDRFNTSNAIQLEPAYNISPGSIMPVIAQKDGLNEALSMKWGLIPFWSKDPRIGFKMINARAEGIEDKPAFRKPLRSNRCLVPTNGFFEWKKLGLTKLAPKVPYYIHLKEDELFSFAGLYDTWRDVEGKEIKSYTIITTKPNTLMGTIHDRMPVILRPGDEKIWLDPKAELLTALDLLKPYSSEEMELYPVSTEVNSPQKNDRELIEPLS